MADPTQEVFEDQQGNAYVWDGKAKQYRPYDPNMGALEEFGRAAVQPALAINEGVQLLNEKMGLPSYQLTEQSPGEIAQANQQRLGMGERGAAAMAGTVAGEVATSAVPFLGQAGKAATVGRMMAVEVGIQGLQSRSVEEFAMRAGGGVAGVGIGAAVAGSMSRLAQMGPRQSMTAATAEILGPINNLTGGMAKQATDYLQQTRLGQSALGRRVGAAGADFVEGARADLGNLGIGGASRNAGAAQNRGKLWDTAPYADEMEQALGVKLQPGSKAILDADRSQAGLAERQWRSHASSDLGRNEIGEVNSAFVDYVAKDLGLPGDMNMANVETARRMVGERLGEMERANIPDQLTPPAKDMVDYVENTLENLQSPDGKAAREAAARLYARSADGEAAKEALTYIRGKLPSMKGAGLSDTRQFLQELESDLAERITAQMDDETRQLYRADQRRYSIIKTIQENDTAFRKGEFNARTFLNALKKKYKPLAERTDDSEFARVLEGVANMNDSVSKGSATYDRLKANAPLIGGGALGGGLLFGG